MSNTEEGIVEKIQYSKLKLLFGLCTFSIIIYQSIAFAIEGNIIWILACFIWLPVWIFIFYRLIFQKYAIAIFEGGIMYNTSIIGNIFIPWEYIQDIIIVDKTFRYITHYFIRVSVVDMKKISEGLGGYKKSVFKAYQLRQLDISIFFLSITINDLKLRIEDAIKNRVDLCISGSNVT